MDEQVGGEQPIENIVAATKKMNALAHTQPPRQQREFARTILSNDGQPSLISRCLGQRSEHADRSIQTLHAKT
jgi:hypothetical protein